MLEAVERFDPDIIVGYTNSGWLDQIRSVARPETQIYPYGLDAVEPGFVVHASDWMQSVLPQVYNNLADRKARGAVHSFDVRFVAPPQT